MRVVKATRPESLYLAFGYLRVRLNCSRRPNSISRRASVMRRPIDCARRASPVYIRLIVNLPIA